MPLEAGNNWRAAGARPSRCTSFAVCAIMQVMEPRDESSEWLPVRYESGEEVEVEAADTKHGPFQWR